MCYLLQGLESEGMGLPRDVSSGATYVGLYCSPPLHTAHSHHTVPYANHAPRCESARSQRTMGSLAVTVVHHTFYGFAIQSMGGQCEHSQTLPTVPCVSRSKVMEMGEHCPSWGKLAKRPIVLCRDVPLSG